ncbi:hypothetical protein ACFU76_23560 [Streptomyces sp. NPDC057539]|uniref:hypothetical protein n=1 Tax=Streptomyces sp. NPDC057539 TaxID=3346159 RepID=UPI0036859083
MKAERRVLEIQTKPHRWGLLVILIAGSTICSTSLRHESALFYHRLITHPGVEVLHADHAPGA